MSILLPLLLGGCGEKAPPEGSESPSENQTATSEEVEPDEPITENEPAGAASVNPNLKYEIKGDAVTITRCDREALGALTIPATIEGNPVTSIKEMAFNGCTGLTSITIPEGVTSIEEGAFFNCTRLASITIPDSVTSIEPEAFFGCRSLTSITLPDSVTSIGNTAFYKCISLKSVTIPDSVTVIGQGAFVECGLRSITIPDSVTSIGYEAFSRCYNLTGITIPDSVTSIGTWAFGKCISLTAVTFLGDAPKAGKEVFKDATPTIYRKPEAKGWGETFAGRPVKLISEKP